MWLELSDSDINRAHDELRAARRELGGYRPPCMDHPRLFDPQDRTSGEDSAQYQRRKAIAEAVCVLSCRVLRQCQELARVDRGIGGTVAGITRVHEDSEQGGA